MKTKELKQDNQNRLMSPMPEGESLSFNKNYMTYELYISIKYN
jgi:hypothetical protein